MQAAQNTSQVFLGVNLKCASCHDSFVNKWKLKDAYGLAAYFSPERHAADVPLRPAAGSAAPGPASSSPASPSRRAPARWPIGAPPPPRLFTDPRLGRLPRTLVNRVWQRLMGRGIVATVDEMDGEPWSPALLDWLAADFAAHGYDIKRLIETIVTSRAYQLPAVRREGEPPARGYVFRGPEVRRLSAEQFADAVGVDHRRVERRPDAAAAGHQRGAARSGAAAAVAADLGRRPGPRMAGAVDDADARARPADPRSGHLDPRHRRDDAAGARADQRRGPVRAGWRAARGGCSASCRPIRSAATPAPWPAATRCRCAFDIDVTGATRLWLVVEDTGSNLPESAAAGVGRRRAGRPGRRRSRWPTLTPVDGAGLRAGTGPLQMPGTRGGGIRVGNPSVVVYDIAGRGFTRFRGVHRHREPAQRDRLDAESGAAVLRLRRGAEPGPPAAGHAGRAAAAGAAAHDRRRGRRSRVPARARARAAAGRAHRRRSPRCADPKRRRPAIGRRPGRSALGGADEAGVPDPRLTAPWTNTTISRRTNAPSTVQRQPPRLHGRDGRRDAGGAGRPRAGAARLAGRAEHGAEEDDRRRRHRAVDGRRHGADRDLRSEALHAVRARRARRRRPQHVPGHRHRRRPHQVHRRGSSRSAAVIDRGAVIRGFTAADLGFILHSRHQYHWHTGYIPPQPMAMPHIGVDDLADARPAEPGHAGVHRHRPDRRRRRRDRHAQGVPHRRLPRLRARAVPDRRSAATRRRRCGRRRS